MSKLLKLEDHGGVVVLSFATNKFYDLGTVEQLEQEFEEVLSGISARNVVIDFAGVNFMITRVINMVLTVLRRMRAVGGEVVLCGMNDNVLRAFELMRLDRIFRIYPDAAKAISSLSS